MSSDAMLAVADDGCRLDTTVDATLDPGLKTELLATSGRLSFSELETTGGKGFDGKGAVLVPTEKALLWPIGDGDREVRRIRRSRIL